MPNYASWTSSPNILAAHTMRSCGATVLCASSCKMLSITRHGSLRTVAIHCVLFWWRHLPVRKVQRKWHSTEDTAKHATRLKERLVSSRCVSAVSTALAVVFSPHQNAVRRLSQRVQCCITCARRTRCRFRTTSASHLTSVLRTTMTLHLQTTTLVQKAHRPISPVTKRTLNNFSLQTVLGNNPVYGSFK